jgi:hypothetical protein
MAGAASPLTADGADTSDGCLTLVRKAAAAK